MVAGHVHVPLSTHTSALRRTAVTRSPPQGSFDEGPPDPRSGRPPSGLGCDSLRRSAMASWPAHGALWLAWKHGSQMRRWEMFL